MKSALRGVVTAIGVGALSISLSGCIVAAVPLIMAAGAAGVAATGFVVYKSVQTTSGGTVRIAFGSADSRRASPPQPLPGGNAVAVWADGGRSRKFAGTLQASGKFRVAEPDVGGLATDTNERNRGYDEVCRNRRVDLVFAAVDEGQSVKSNMLSFKRGALIHKLALEGYGCTAHRIVWVDTMAVVIESGGQPTPQSEIDAVAGQAWGERVLQARAEG